MYLFRRMTESDIPHVLLNERGAYSHPWSAQHFKDALSPPNEAWVLECDGRVVGHAVISRILDEGQILNLCVASGRQGEGLGRELLSRVMYQMGLNGVQCIFLEVRVSNSVARTLYESVGFEAVGVRKDYYPAADGREDAVVMQYQVSGRAS
ncbi:MAG: ribosomal-protein-alanine N-acetyltransferase [Gammaproteobacteria bacterium]|nr:MAG: ribosomal-protein-alanine N-acetyltransferase [Gammaproteobacteria bacterium]